MRTRHDRWALLVAVFGMGFLAGEIRAQNRDREESRVAETFLNQERDVWELESRLLREAMDAVVGGESASTGEMAYRRLIRKGRTPTTLRKVRGFVEDYLQPETRDLLKEIADANGVAPEQVFADYLTLEATIDFSLMASAYNTVHGANFDRFPTDAKRLLKSLVDNLRKPPVPSNDIEVGKIRGDRLTVIVFGCEINEEVASVDMERKSARLVWRSNYSFLRDLKDRRDPQEKREETMVLDGDRWTVSYQAEIEEFIDSTGRTEWGKKVKELVNTEGYLKEKDPLDERKSRKVRYQYDPDSGDEFPSRVVGRREKDEGRSEKSDRRRYD